MLLSNQIETSRRLSVGAESLPPGPVHFRLWAPRPDSVWLVLQTDPGDPSSQQSFLMDADQHGYRSLIVPDARPGMLYGFRLDDDPAILPDPASRFQPAGLRGLSEIIDPNQFTWSDASWPGPQPSGQVLYEMHIGTFTRDGTWEAARAELAELARLGVTIVEVMPVAEFPGSFGWGYDGVLMFAPTRLYGRPDDFRRFVDTAHRLNMGVILDVVYNHFGGIDNYLPRFSESYTTDRYDNEWAEAINFDGPDSEPVREYFLSNARYWIEEFHLDGFRFDATQSIHDHSPRHILCELTEAARQAAGQRSLYLIAENEPQDVRLLKPVDLGGCGMMAIWNDDFHHTAKVCVSGKNPAYYSDYNGTASELAATIKHSFLYQGQASRWQRKPRGTPTRGLPCWAFVSYIQNHDQVANSATGRRIDRLTSPGRFRAITTVWLLAPQTPLLFQGQEFAAASPFYFFADYSGEIAKAVARGRADFMSQFPEVASEEGRRRLPDPSSRGTFERCQLDLSQRRLHAPCYQLHADLLALRRGDPVFARQDGARLEAAALTDNCLVLRYWGGEHGDRLVLANFGRDFNYSPVVLPLFAPPIGRSWHPLFSSDDRRYDGNGAMAVQSVGEWFIPGETAVVLTSNEPSPR